MSTWRQPRTASIAAEPVSPLVAPTIVTCSPRCAEHVVEQPPDELQGDVLERQRRAVEQLGQPLPVVELDERHDGGVAERGVGLVAQPTQLGRGDVVADERVITPIGRLGVAPPPTSSSDCGRGSSGPVGGHVQPAVGGQAGQQDVGEAELRRSSTRRDVAHVNSR